MISSQGRPGTPHAGRTRLAPSQHIGSLQSRDSSTTVSIMAKDPPARELLASKDEREMDRLMLLVPPRHGKTEPASVSRESRSECGTRVDAVRAKSDTAAPKVVAGCLSQPCRLMRHRG